MNFLSLIVNFIELFRIVGIIEEQILPFEIRNILLNTAAQKCDRNNPKVLGIEVLKFYLNKRQLI